MRKLKFLFIGAGVGATLLASIAMAQQEPPVPVEIWACDFLDGQDMDDLRAVNTQFNNWADDQGITDMVSTMLTPIFVSPDDANDVYYLDAWVDGAAMGAGYTALYGSSFERVASAFDEVIDCESHANFGGLLVVPPAPDRDGGPVQFQDCTLRENRSVRDAIEAITAFSEGAGPRLGGFALLLPFVGQPRESTYDFKLVAVFDSYQNMGNAFDTMFSGGAGAVANSTVNNVMTCDRPRMYSQVVVRDSDEF